MSDVLVAVGTLILALATFALVWVTYKLAVSSEASLRAQVRPVLIPARAGTLNYVDEADQYGNRPGLTIPIQNVGSGPALYIRTEMDPQGWAEAQQGPIVALAAGDEVVLRFGGAAPQEMVQLLMDYRDLGGRTYSTAVTVDLTAQSAYDAQLSEGSRTHHGDAVYPQPGLRDAAQRAPRLGTRIRRAGREIRGRQD